MTNCFNFAPVKMTETLRNFINEHSKDDLSELLLSGSRYDGIDVKEAVVQIKARNSIKDKLPSWYCNDRLLFPSTLAAEQCSSEITASYKQKLVRSRDCICDLTGGLGVDTYFFSKKAGRVVYVEKDERYCKAARYNMDILGATNVCVVNADAVEFVVNNSDADSRVYGLFDECVSGADVIESSDAISGNISGADVFYIDPARRGTGNKRMFAIGDCEPDLTKIWPMLLKKECVVIVKLSPMLDITQVVAQLPGVCEIHIVSVKNECKELLAIAGSISRVKQHKEIASCLPMTDSNATNSSATSLVGGTTRQSQYLYIVCANYTSENDVRNFSFFMSEEQSAASYMAEDIGLYLYEPNSSILKAGAYKLVALRYNVKKLHTSSHLYTSDDLVPSFPGRVFEVMEIIPFNNRICKDLVSTIPQANIATRNFPISVDELRKRTHITDGGNIYLFATTLKDNKKVIVKCQKPSQ